MVTVDNNGEAHDRSVMDNTDFRKHSYCSIFNYIPSIVTIRAKLPTNNNIAANKVVFSIR